MLESLEYKSNQRQWLKQQNYGELDESRLVDAIIGEKNVFKTRKIPERRSFGGEKKPKRIRFLFDCSGSMYRFDFHDHRLERSLETFALVSEALEGFEEKIEWDAYGHSGDSDKIELVQVNKYPKNRKERFAVMDKIAAHAQFCWSGDNTVESTQLAIHELGKEGEGSEDKYVIVISDANFSRYGISPKEFGNILTSDKTVQAFAIFIGSLGKEAFHLKESLPVGHSFVCESIESLPAIVEKILSQVVEN